MISEDLSENKRGRKRQNNDEKCTPADQEKKEKNRLAAQKCREKKERFIADLKTRNEELQRENQQLVNEKKSLFKKAENYKAIIDNHCKKGCKIPDHFQEMWNKYNAEESEVNENNIDENTCFSLENIEANSSPPSSPESVFSEKLPSKLQSKGQENCTIISAAPTALFSGTPLIKTEMSRSKRINSSNIKLSSSSYIAGPVETTSVPFYKYTNLSQILRSTQIPPALAPISMASYKQQEVQIGAESANCDNCNVAYEIQKTDEKLENTTSFSDGIDTANIHHTNFQSNHTSDTILQSVEAAPMGTAVQQLSNSCESAGSENFMSTNEQEGNKNLSSMDFLLDFVEGYSFSEEFQEREPAKENNQYTSEINQSEIQSIHTNEALSQSSVPTDNALISANAPELLQIGSGTSASLQEQLIKSYSASSSFTEGNSAANCSYVSQSVNQPIMLMNPGPNQFIRSTAQQQNVNTTIQPLIQTENVAQRELESLNDNHRVIYLPSHQHYSDKLNENAASIILQEKGHSQQFNKPHKIILIKQGEQFQFASLQQGLQYDMHNALLNSVPK